MNKNDNTLVMDKPLGALFRDGETARKAINLLTELGYNNDEIHVVIKDTVQGEYHSKNKVTDAASETQEETKAGPAAATMASIGAALGAAAAISLSVATAGGSLIVVGPVAAGGAVLGAGVGGLFGGLLGSSVSNEETTFYEQGVHEGRLLVMIKPHSNDDREKIRQEWTSLGGEFRKI